MFVLISYDIKEDRTRTRLAKKLKNFGPRVQKSVFEGDVQPEEFEQLDKLLSEVELEENDSIRLYRLCGECVKGVKIWGIGKITEDKPYYIG
jgi:CRISPR-associated protein Cas2